MDKILKVKDLCKTYIADKRQNNVLRNISFEIEKGDMVAIMGPSGSGKSTLLYTVSGMDKSTRGSIVYNGRDITEMKQDELAAVRLDEMGFIFQQMYMMKNLTILDNILLPAFESRKGKESKEQKVERAKALMKKLAISEIADNDINEVSGGQLQRACICRSMINNPGILFADEPTGALNRSTSREVMDEIVRLNDSGTTVMMVTHDAGIAAKCKRVLYLVDGTIKGEYITDNNLTQTEKERSLNNWLMDLGW